MRGHLLSAPRQCAHALRPPQRPLPTPHATQVSAPTPCAPRAVAAARPGSRTGPCSSPAGRFAEALGEELEECHYERFTPLVVRACAP